MEQPKLEVQHVPAIRLTITWSPQTGQIEIGWPNVDDIVKLGMLEMAKTVLVEMRAKAGMAQPSPLVLPRMAH